MGLLWEAESVHPHTEMPRQETGNKRQTFSVSQPCNGLDRDGQA